MRFKYQSTHLPTGVITETEVEADSEADFCVYLNDWNRTGNGIYRFVSANHISPRGHIAHMFKETATIQEAKRTLSDVNDAGGYWTDYEY